MPAAPTLSTTIIAGNTGHVADSNTVHTVIDAIYLATIGGGHSTALTLAQSDSGEIIPLTAALTVTVPQLAAGTSIELFRDTAGAITVSPGSGVTLVGPSGATLSPRVQGSTISLLWLTTTRVLVGGDLT